jgi:hypothetical protein
VKIGLTLEKPSIPCECLSENPERSNLFIYTQPSRCQKLLVALSRRLPKQFRRLLSLTMCSAVGSNSVVWLHPKAILIFAAWISDVCILFTNVTLHPFASQEQLEAQLSAADILIVTLRAEWTGAVVP